MVREVAPDIAHGNKRNMARHEFAAEPYNDASFFFKKQQYGRHLGNGAQPELASACLKFDGCSATSAAKIQKLMSPGTSSRPSFFRNMRLPPSIDVGANSQSGARRRGILKVFQFSSCFEH